MMKILYKLGEQLELKRLIDVCLNFDELEAG